GPIVAIATLPGCSQSCFGMPAFSITAAHLAMSLFMRSVIASGVAAAHLHAQLAYLLLDIRTRQDLVDGPGQDLDNRLGRRSGHGNAVPTHDFKVFDTGLQLVRQNAHPDVCDATCPVRNDELHWPSRIIGLRAGGHNRRDCREKRTGDERIAQQADCPTADGNGDAFAHPYYFQLTLL